MQGGEKQKMSRGGVGAVGGVSKSDKGGEGRTQW